ncbi:hypothetical protein CP532_2107 [Ophiocordyceps camponoti-leonardi (nom. inval.)]|nr:hypothetical protein CP532_2107 [Ophiocordyceps camponoti-leonardi (nom. inval.)]
MYVDLRHIPPFRRNSHARTPGTEMQGRPLPCQKLLRRAASFMMGLTPSPYSTQTRRQAIYLAVTHRVKEAEFPLRAETVHLLWNMPFERYQRLGLVQVLLLFCDRDLIMPLNNDDFSFRPFRL